jgi:hypothetical protein
MSRRKPIEARFYRSLSISEIEEVAASFKEDLQRESNRRIRRHDSAGALAAIEAMEYTDKFLTTLKLKAGSQFGRPKEPKEPKKRIRAIYIPEAIKEASARVSVTDEDKETQKRAREIAAASRSMGHPKHY